jgi:hypothetical protein
VATEAAATLQIRRGGSAARDQAGAAGSIAFSHDPVAMWLLPDPAPRRNVLAGYLGALWDAVTSNASYVVDVTDDGCAAAVWALRRLDDPQPGARSAHARRSSGQRARHPVTPSRAARTAVRAGCRALEAGPLGAVPVARRRSL